MQYTIKTYYKSNQIMNVVSKIVIKETIFAQIKISLDLFDFHWSPEV